MGNIAYSDNIEEAFMRVGKGQVYKFVIENAEKLLIQKALERSYGNQISAAKLLGINRNTLRTKIKKLGITVDRFKT